MNARQRKKTLKQAQGGGWPQRVYLLPGNHPERQKWRRRLLRAIGRWITKCNGFAYHSVTDEQEFYLDAGDVTQVDMGVGDHSHADPWTPRYYSGAERRRVVADHLARSLMDLGEDFPF